MDQDHQRLFGKRLPNSLNKILRRKGDVVSLLFCFEGVKGTLFCFVVILNLPDTAGIAVHRSNSSAPDLPKPVPRPG